MKCITPNLVSICKFAVCAQNYVKHFKASRSFELTILPLTPVLLGKTLGRMTWTTISVTEDLATARLGAMPTTAGIDPAVPPSARAALPVSFFLRVLGLLVAAGLLWLVLSLSLASF